MRGAGLLNEDRASHAISLATDDTAGEALHFPGRRRRLWLYPSSAKSPDCAVSCRQLLDRGSQDSPGQDQQKNKAKQKKKQTQTRRAGQQVRTRPRSVCPTTIVQRATCTLHGGIRTPLPCSQGRSLNALMQLGRVSADCCGWPTLIPAARRARSIWKGFDSRTTPIEHQQQQQSARHVNMSLRNPAHPVLPLKNA